MEKWESDMVAALKAERDAAVKRADESEASAAAMRQRIGVVRDRLIGVGSTWGANLIETFLGEVDAGRALLERHAAELAEVRRVLMQEHDLRCRRDEHAAAELRQAREEIERLRVDLHLKEKSGQELLDKFFANEAALGQAVAALRLAECHIDNSMHDKQACAEGGCAICETVRAMDDVFADPTCAAAGEYVRELEAVYEAAKALRETWGFGNWHREDAAEERLIEALDKVKHV